MDFEGFAFGSQSNFEERVIALYGSMNRIPYRHFTSPKKVPKGWIPVGTVNWVEAVTGWKIKPNYFPSFMKDYIQRDIWTTSEWPKTPCWVKPEDKYKRFEGRSSIPFSEIPFNMPKIYPNPPYICSGMVDFVDEWRYYISGGKIIFSGWYKGILDEDKEAPSLQIYPPEDWVGSVDMGRTNDNRFLIIEAHHPYATGWYGRFSDYSIYAQWLIDGYFYLKKFYTKEE